MPRLMRIWRTTEADGFNREADTDQVAAEGQQPTQLGAGQLSRTGSQAGGGRATAVARGVEAGGSKPLALSGQRMPTSNERLALVLSDLMR